MLPVSDRARQALALAQEEARALNHTFVGTEHILLGLLREEDGIAATVLASLGVTYDRVRASVVWMMGRGVEPTTGELPLTDPAEAVVERAGREASVLGEERVGTDHILVALISEPRGAAARILLQLDADAAAIRSAVAAARAGLAEAQVLEHDAEVQALAGQLAQQLLGVQALAVPPQAA